MKRLLFPLVLAAFFWLDLIAGTTGKIAGTITDATDGSPLPGVNVVLDGTTMGAATNLDGYYVILNVPPGSYSLRASIIGFGAQRVDDVRVEIDLTTTIDFQMKQEALEAEEVVVVAKRPVVQKDISGSQVNIESKQIQALPVRSVSQALTLEAGIIDDGEEGLLIRGGDADETAFMVDGFSLRDERNNEPYTNISLSSIQEVKVQTGGFTAEYGNLRSGLVNVVTKEGDRNSYGGTVSFRYSPEAAKHFGPSGFDPMGYWNRPYLDDDVAWVGTENGPWDQHLQDQYPKFEGWNAVSERLLNDEDPTNDLTPAAAQRLWKWQRRKQGDIKSPDYDLDLGFGGPMPVIGSALGDLRFHFSFRRRETMYLIPLSREGLTDNFWQLKMTSNISPTMKLTLSGIYTDLYGVSNNQIGLPSIYRSPGSVADELSLRSFIAAVMYNTDYYAPSDQYRHLISAKLTHTISSNTFYELKLERGGTFYKTQPGALRDTSRVFEIVPGFFTSEAPFGFWPFPSSAVDGMRMGVGMSNSRDSTRITQITGSFDLTSQIDNINQIKFGVEVVATDHKARFGGVDLTLPASRPSSSWESSPVRGAAYLQDKIEFKGLIANLGLRLEYNDPSILWWNVDPFDVDFYGLNYRPFKDSTFARQDSEAQWYLSPRLGISHPITENSKLFFNYGHARSWPDAQTLYMIQRSTDNSTQLIGNPNLNISKTVQYELGFEQNLFDQFLLRAAGYYKDVSDNVPNSRGNWILFLNELKGINYRLADDNFYEDIRGFEVTVSKRATGGGGLLSWMTGFINYTYQVSKSGFFGKLAVSDNPGEQRSLDRDFGNNEIDKPVPRPFFRSNLALNTPPDFGPKLGGFALLGDTQLSLVTNWRAGRFATYTRGQSTARKGLRNNVQWPDFFRMDLRLNKKLSVGGLNFSVFVDVNNVFDTKVFSPFAFSEGNDFRDYMDSLLWPEEVGRPLGFTEFGDDRLGDLRPDDVEFDPLEANPSGDPEIEARNERRRENKSYINNPNLRWLYYLNPRDVFFGVKIDF